MSTIVRKTSEKDPDRRIQRTRQALREALLALIVAKGYEAVSVQDIAEQANIGRATFYLHYPDKETLIVEHLRELLANFRVEVDLKSHGDLENSALILLEGAFRYFEEHHVLYRRLLSDKSALVVTTSMNEVLSEVIGDQMRQFVPPGSVQQKSDVQLLEVVVQHIAGSLLRVIKWWLDNDMPFPPDHMARLHVSLIQPGLVNTLLNPV
jgi:AcrR family transcriptional regulator